MLLFARQRRHVARWLEVATIIVRYGGYHIIDYLGLRHMVPPGIRPPEAEPDLAAKLRSAIEELGPTFIKLGQLLSTRPDLIPPRYLEELVKLQDTAPPVPFEKIRVVVEEELERPLSEAFRYFSETPLAAASLGQVHGAILHDGTPVVVKVQRPDIRRVVETDIEIIFDLAQRIVQRSERARVLNLVEFIEEFQFTTHEELDYTREGRNMDRMREMLQANKRILVPTVFWELTTSRVLTQQRVHGTKITEVARLRELGMDPSELARVIGDAFMQQIFIDGFFHADPHPGNLNVTDEGVVALLDLGMVARLDESMREVVTRMLIGLTEQDSPFFAEQILALGRELRPVNRKAFTADADRMLRRYYDLPTRDINMGQLLRDTLTLCTEHFIQMPSNFALLVKALANLDGIAKILDPDYSYLATVQRHLGRAVTEQLQWHTLSLDLYRALGDSKRLLLNLPGRTTQLLTKLVDGDVRFHIELRGIDELTRHLDRMSNRIAYSLVVSALLMGSALFLLAKVPPFIRGYPAIGVAAFGAAVVMGVWLLVAILRSGSLR